MWEIRYGDPKVPKKDWAIFQQFITDPQEGARLVKSMNSDLVEREAKWAPDGQYTKEAERFNLQRQQRQQLEAEYVYRGRQRDSFYYDPYPTPRPSYLYKPDDLHYRYTLMKVPKEGDFLARELARTDNPILFDPELAREANWPVWLCPNFVPPRMVSIFTCSDHAVENRRTEVKLGKFMREHCRYMSDEAIADYCAKVGVQYDDSKLVIAETCEEIRKVYENGPSSCMKKPAASFGIADCEGIYRHPAEVYANGNIAVATVVREDEITARVVINRERKTWLRMYGDTVRLEAMLEAEGYRYSDNTLRGEKLLRIKVPNESYVLCPYFDGNHNQVEVHDDHLYMKPYIPVIQGSERGYANI